MVNLIITICAAYPLSRKRFVFKKIILTGILFTMIFSSGIIPQFILVTQLGLYGTRWAIILPAAISTWNLIIMKTSFAEIPDSLIEAATIDGCNDLSILWRIVVPVSKAIIAVVALFCVVGFWNTYFSAVIYLPNPEYHPLQLFLVKYVIQDLTMPGMQSAETFLYYSQLKYSVIIITILPIIMVYPFLQRYFVKGVMVGSIKE